MRIVVLVKQVPDVAELRLDPTTRTLIRDGVAAVMNMHDRTALALALQLRERPGGEVVALSMGPPQAIAVLRECLASGADRAVLITDRALAGSDTLVTARVLATAIRRLGDTDVVVCGQRSTDSETGQVGPEVATLLGYHAVTDVCRLVVEGSTIEADREIEEGIETVATRLPALITVVESMLKPRRVPPGALAAVPDAAVDRWDLTTLGMSPDEVGLGGSPTVVVGVRSDTVERRGLVLGGPEAAGDLVDALVAEGAFDDGAAEETEPPPAIRTDGPRLVVVAESDGGVLHRSVGELVGEASRAAGSLGGRVTVVTVADERIGDRLAALGADEVVAIQGVSDAAFSGDAWAAAVGAVLRPGEDLAVVAAATPRGRDFVPRLAATFGLGMVGDAVGLEVDADGRLLALKPAFGGMVVAPIACRTRPMLVTLRPGACRPFRPDEQRQVPMVRVSAPVAAPEVTVRSRRIDASSSLLGAARVVCVGFGVGGPEGVAEVGRFATELGAALAGTRRVVDSGWLPRSHQVGVSGHALVARLYIGIGVRGAANHLVGLRRVGTVVAVNREPSAPIFAAADYGLVGDWREVLSALRSACAARGLLRSAPAP